METLWTVLVHYQWGIILSILYPAYQYIVLHTESLTGVNLMFSFIFHPNKLLNEQSICQLFEMPCSCDGCHYNYRWKQTFRLIEAPQDVMSLKEVPGSSIRNPILYSWYFPISVISLLTHWGQVTHICVSKLTIIGSDNGLLPGRCHAIIRTSAEYC